MLYLQSLSQRVSSPFALAIVNKTLQIYHNHEGSNIALLIQDNYIPQSAGYRHTRHCIQHYSPPDHLL